MRQPPRIVNPQHVTELLEGRKHLCNVRDSLPSWHELSVDIDKIVGQIEKLLGY